MFKHVAVSQLVALLVASSVCAQNTSIPIVVPDDAKPLPQNLLGFSIEQDRWPDWAGTHARNNFTHDALANYAHLTGKPPHIRVGANTEDHTIWSPTVTIESADFPPPNTITPYPEATRVVVGDEYYALSRFLPAGKYPVGTHMTWGINLGLDNATNAMNMANSILRAFSSAAVQAAGVVLDLLEIGNEPDLYKNNGLRPSNWTVQQYVADWINISTPVAQAIESQPLEAGPVAIQAASFAGQGFTPRQIFSLGILNSVPGKLVTTISQHRYSAAFCSGGDFPLTSFMSKANVRGNLTVFRDDIEATLMQGLPYILGETGSIACHGAPGVSNTAGAALWVIDYTLQAATQDISEVLFHEGVGFKYNFIQPVTLNRSTIDGSPLTPPEQPHIQPSYYAGLFINTFIGSSGNTQISELTVWDDNVSGYAAYEHGKLVRAAFVNLDAWLVSSVGLRPSVHVNPILYWSQDGSTTNTTGGSVNANAAEAAWKHEKVNAKRIIINHADDVQNLTWAGQSWEKTGDVRPTGRLVVEKVDLAKGFDLRSTEAILLEFTP
ncbi:glycoside hydrolase family 79 protein [Irpex rosettiformis]|uniref:Glycoside hydrolase family 79 protein n=1 Tax=Irpex rosettiformis TaxID=378272 RepID=A0ACB8UEK0_9APHY|nr:glycoside hydrolase family 79 protein [Irpex rosettiformis]